MQILRRSGRPRRRAQLIRTTTPWAAALAAAAALLLAPAALDAQRPDRVEPDPDALRKEGFDLDRVILWEHRNFDPLRDPEWMSLRGALNAGNLNETSPVLTFEQGGETWVLGSVAMSYHHVAQGELEGEPWMVTF
jgi:hypothetical protein